MNIVPASPENIRAAAETIRAGKLVAIPTETVYGLAADATNAAAIQKVFFVKGRPVENPLIVHLAEPDDLDQVAIEIPDTARELAERFWPGPLTLVLKKREVIPNEVSGGRDTVAVRIPDHPVARAVIEMADRPLAAPSANRFMRLSPTRAEHIEEEIGRHLEMILDGGPCRIGLESTVLDLTEESPRILRPGGISRGDLQATLGMQLHRMPPGSNGPKSPGMYPRHYSPEADVRLVTSLSNSAAGLTFEEPENKQQIKMPMHPTAYASALYDALHHLDRKGPKEIQIQLPPDEPEWEAVIDRLKKASGEP